ncbi:helix-turn-helix domain-containing protein [Thiorhodovibrio frisius]|uniref:DNA-binding protein, excisionase family n=1 Tax=Thiorhodovibrio frisius TaxID=631362 RepID=H8Z7C3_9GAMM|nr:helix-turn-helix domain-containing protein [Thiorhodovibrio frisius]EIC19839.1 DNA-binding protein, excisionase family [Thiorhodovibrio frisius]
MNNSEENFLLDTKQAAAYLNISPSTLETWRVRKTCIIPYLKLGKSVRYRKQDLDSYIESMVVN